LRENCGGAYFGPKVEKDDYASDTWEYSRTEIERVARVAGAMALQHNPPLTVTSADKANVLASGRLWRKIVTEIFAKEFPEVELKHQLADSLAMLMIKDPRQFNGGVDGGNVWTRSAHG
jgi:3-isopropylmalate dehydrogenase